MPERALLITVLAFLLLRIAATFLPAAPRMWGIDFTRYVASDALTLLALAVPLLMFIPGTGALADRLNLRMPARWMPAALAAVLTLLAAWLSARIHMVFALYGDGSYYMTEVVRMLANPQSAPGFIKPTAWLSAHVIAWLTSALQPQDARVPYVAAGVLSMILLGAGTYALLRGERPSRALLVSVPLLTSAGTLQLFGYVELYALSYVLSILYLLSVWRAARGMEVAEASPAPGGLRPLALPAALLALAVLASGVALVLVPSLLFLAAVRLAPAARARTIAAACIGILLAGFAAAVIIFGHDLWNPYILPLVSGEMVTPAGMHEGMFRYTMLSGAHLADVVNVVVLTGGACAFVLPVLLAMMRKDDISDPTLLFSFVLLGSALPAVLGGYAYFGLARDWDAMSIPLLAVPFAASTAVGVLARDGRLRIPRILPALTAACAAGFLLWMHLNTGGNAVARFEDILAADANLVAPQRTHTGLESVRKFRAYAGDTDGELRAMRSMLAVGWDLDATYRALHGRAMDQADDDARRAEYAYLLDHIGEDARRATDRNVYGVLTPKRAREIAASILIGARYRGDAQAARAKIAELASVLPAWKERRFVDAVFDEGRPMASKADDAAAGVDTTCGDAILLSVAADHLVAAARYSEAAPYYERALKVEPHALPAVYVRLARLYDTMLHDLPASVRTLQRCADNCLLYPKREEVLRMLEEKQSRLGRR